MYRETLVARRAKKDSPLAGGWNAFLTATIGAELLDPTIANWLSANCDKALPGWPHLRNEFARQIEPAKQITVAHAVQERAFEVTPYVPFGQWYALTATRKSTSSLLKTPTIVFWKLRKSET